MLFNPNSSPIANDVQIIVFLKLIFCQCAGVLSPSPEEEQNMATRSKDW